MRVLALATAVLLTAAAQAEASVVTYRCGAGFANLCRVDAATKKVSRLTSNGRAGRGPVYSAVSASRNGRRHAFIFGNDLFASGSTLARGRRRLDRRVVTAELRDDGRQIAFTQLVLEGFRYVPYLFTIGTARGSEKESVARMTLTTGWLGRRLLRSTGGGPEPQRVCVLARNDDFECERDVASHPARDLFDPEGSPNGRFVVATAVPRGGPGRRIRGSIALFSAGDGHLVRELTRGPGDSGPSFSPDGRRVVFERGKGLYTVGVGGGRAKRLVRRGIGPSWSAR
jgi:hypothetical protein